MDKQSRHQRPDFALFKVVQTEDEIVLGKRRVLLPCPKARREACEYQQCIGLQECTRWGLLIYFTLAQKFDWMAVTPISARNRLRLYRDQKRSS